MKTSTSTSTSPSIESAYENRTTDTPQACAHVQTLLIENAILSRAMARQQERHSKYVQETKQIIEVMLARQSQLEQQVRELLQVNRHNHDVPSQASPMSNLSWC